MLASALLYAVGGCLACLAGLLAFPNDRWVWGIVALVAGIAVAWCGTLLPW